MGPYGGECINNAIRFYCGISKLEECFLCVKGTKRKRELTFSDGREEERVRSVEGKHTLGVSTPDAESGMRMKT